jgi:hypothetical protein
MDLAKGGMVNNWHDEFLAEYHRQRILQETEQICLERLALKSRAYRPRFLERAMFNFGNWMISTGRQLCKRYEIPVMDCNKSSTNNGS